MSDGFATLRDALTGDYHGSAFDDYLSTQAARGIAYAEDAAIDEALDATLGEGWTPESVQGRVMVHGNKDGSATVLFDGKPILEFDPVITTVVGGTRHVSRASRKQA